MIVANHHHPRGVAGAEPSCYGPTRTNARRRGPCGEASMGYFDELDGWSTGGERDLDELAPLLDADSRLELHRRLVMGGGPSGTSTRHQEAVEVFQAQHGLGQP